MFMGVEIGEGGGWIYFIGGIFTSKYFFLSAATEECSHCTNRKWCHKKTGHSNNQQQPALPLLRQKEFWDLSADSTTQVTSCQVNKEEGAEEQGDIP